MYIANIFEKRYISEQIIMWFNEEMTFLNNENVGDLVCDESI